ncbi:MAG: DUF2933 domain-containing protein [Gemmatimonadales bacterium]|nr:DUF2933 domain-containing protein [Gemmatimonadales bacterium]
MTTEVRYRASCVLGAFAAIAAFFLVTEHTAHTFGMLPFLLLVACPLIHMLSHGRHRARRDDGGRPDRHGQDGRGATP